MSALSALRGLIPSFDSGDDLSGVEGLRVLLEQQMGGISLEAEYGEPTFDTVGEPTAVFPYTVYQDGSTYRTGAKEFVVPDNGLNDSDSDLVAFLEAHGVFGLEDLEAIEGQRDSAQLTEGGDIEVTF